MALLARRAFFAGWAVLGLREWAGRQCRLLGSRLTGGGGGGGGGLSFSGGPVSLSVSPRRACAGAGGHRRRVRSSAARRQPPRRRRAAILCWARFGTRAVRACPDSCRCGGWGTLLYNYTPFSETGLFGPRRETLILFRHRLMAALARGYWLRPPCLRCEEGRRLIYSSAGRRPAQCLAALGAVFAFGGVGAIIGGLAGATSRRREGIFLYGGGCSHSAWRCLPCIMGHAFAAFPVIGGGNRIPALGRAIWWQSGR